MATKEILKDVPIGDIKPNPGNPRINDEAVDDVVKSIQHGGYVSPIIVDETNTILAGNTRYKALTKIGTAVIDIVIRVTGWSEEQKRRFILADNKTHEKAVWDWEKLHAFDSEMLKDVGFNDDDLDRILGTFAGDKDPDEMPAAVPTYGIKLGDIFMCGKHRVMCGNSLSPQDIDKLMDGHQVRLGFTSPPYWVGKSYEAQDSMEAIDEFIAKACEQYVRAVRKDESRIVINTGTGFTTSFDKKGKRHTMLLIDKWANCFYTLGWNMRYIRHWIKEGQIASKNPKNDMIDQHNEFLGTFEARDGTLMQFEDMAPLDDINIIETFYNRDGKGMGHNKTMQKWAMRSFWDDIRGTAGEAGHTASFPVELVIRHLLLYTRKDDTVLDIFFGAGTTMIACQIMGRVCYGMELSPEYMSLAIERWAQFTKEEPIRINDSKIWSLIKLENGGK